MQLQLERTNCQYPKNTPNTAYYYGCRCVRCRTTKAALTKSWVWDNPEKKKLSGKSYTLKLKVETFNAYGGCVCNCCGETELKFLSLDHVFNDGYKDNNKVTGRCGGTSTYVMLKKKGYPDSDRFQVLCMNCNFGKKLNKGVCPHKETV